jgi:hypothetical protein
LEQDLVHCQRGHGKPVIAFSDRFLGPMGRANKNPDSAHEFTPVLIGQLPRSAVNWLNAIKATNPEN